MSRNVVIAVLLVVLVAAAAIGVGGYAYNLGVAQGMAETGKVVAPGAPPFAYGAPYGFYRPWGFGFGSLGCLFPFGLFLLFFFLVRGLFWHGHGWGGRRGYRGAPEMFEQWHREAHGTPAPEPPAAQPRS